MDYAKGHTAVLLAVVDKDMNACHELARRIDGEAAKSAETQLEKALREINEAPLEKTVRELKEARPLQASDAAERCTFSDLPDSLIFKDVQEPLGYSGSDPLTSALWTASTFLPPDVYSTLWDVCCELRAARARAPDGPNDETGTDEGAPEPEVERWYRVKGGDMADSLYSQREVDIYGPRNADESWEKVTVRVEEW